MEFVSVSDRKELALVNRTWYEASLYPALQHDVIINLQSFLAAQSLPSRPATNLVVDSLGEDTYWLTTCKDICSNLHTLSIRGCDITETNFITFLSHCHSLTTLDLTGCNSPFMSGKILEKSEDQKKLKSSLGNVKELNLVSLRYLSNQTFERLVSVLGKLEKLDLSCCQILFHSTKHSSYADGNLFTFDSILNYVSQNPSLQYMGLSKTAVNNEALKALADIPNLSLKSLDLSNCRDVGEQGLVYLVQKQNEIEFLNLTACPEVGDAIVIAVIKNLTNLKHLFLKQCTYVSDRSVSLLREVTSLKTLNLSGVMRPSQSGLTSGLTANMTSLTHLSLNGNSAVNDVVLTTICVNLTNLKSLDLSSCFYITDTGVVAIFHYLQDLNDLNLSNCKKITDLGLLGLSIRNDDEDRHVDGDCKCARKHTSTQVFKLGINMDDLPHITQEQIKEIEQKMEKNGQDKHAVASINRLQNLESLTLQGISNLSDLSIAQIIKFPNLKSLNLNMCSRLTDSSLINIVNSNPKLNQISLSGTGITDIGVKYLVEKVRRLNWLCLSNCSGVTDYSMTAVGNYGSRLRYLDVSYCGHVTEWAVEYVETRLTGLREVHKRFIKPGNFSPDNTVRLQ